MMKSIAILPGSTAVDIVFSSGPYRQALVSIPILISKVFVIFELVCALIYNTRTSLQIQPFSFPIK